MASYNKSFNFRNGVQVDNDNFVVNPNGLVGIGTSIPREFLDVYGTTKVTGLVTTTNLAVSGVSTFYSDVKVGSGIVFYPSTGIVSATTFYGSAAGLTGFYAVATDGWYIDSANSGIFTSFKVGIGTTNPQYSLQVGQDPLTGNGFAVDAITGNVNTTGTITANLFGGSGASLTTLNASNISSGTLNNARLPSNIDVGIVTATTFYGSLTGTATTASSITPTADIIVNSINSGFSTTGISTSFSTTHVGTGGTGFAALNSGRIGVGTALPTSEFQIRKSSATLLEVISDTSQARISIGQSVGLGNSTATLRFGNSAKTFDIINNDTGNINMYLHNSSTGIDTGRFAWIYGKAGIELASLTYNGNFGIGEVDPTTKLHVKGTSNITGIASFGNNVTINGILTLGSGSNISIIDQNNNSILNRVNLNTSSGVSTFANILVSSGSSIGIGTTNAITGFDARNEIGLINTLGIATNTKNNLNGISLYNQGASSLVGIVGIGSTATIVDQSHGSGGALQVFGGIRVESDGDFVMRNYGMIGINSMEPVGAIDLRYASLSAAYRSPFYPPILTTTERNDVTGQGYVLEGGVIYNSDAKRLQFYNGTGWVGIATTSA
jgi:hypothetical protein